MGVTVCVCVLCTPLEALGICSQGLDWMERYKKYHAFSLSLLVFWHRLFIVHSPCKMGKSRQGIIVCMAVYV